MGIIEVVILRYRALLFNFQKEEREDGAARLFANSSAWIPQGR